MTIERAIVILKQHQKWRLGLIDEAPCTPKQLSEAIETIIAYHESKSKTNDTKRKSRFTAP
jgi:hypothetical protein